MSYAIIRNANYKKDNLAGLYKHNERKNTNYSNKDITKENADYSVTLKIGQKCRFESTDKITGHEISGSGYDYKDVNENCVEITGTSVGKANGYIYVGESKKSFYITIEKNPDNKTLEPIVLKVNTSNGNNKPSENKPSKEQEKNEQQKPQQQKQPSKDTTTTQSKLPQTGVSNIIYVFMIFSIILLTVFGVKFKKYKDIK